MIIIIIVTISNLNININLGRTECKKTLLDSLTNYILLLSRGDREKSFRHHNNQKKKKKKKKKTRKIILETPIPSKLMKLVSSKHCFNVIKLLWLRVQRPDKT